jgi:hypothetical protein
MSIRESPDKVLYAVSSSNDLYHLLRDPDDGDKTLCGLAVAPIIIDRAVKSSWLHLISSAQDRRSLCSDCDERRQRRSD